MIEGKRNLVRRVAWLIVVIAPPSMLATISPEWVGSHLFTAIGLIMAYEAVLAFAAFVGEVAGDLRMRWRYRVGDLLDQRLIRRLSSQYGQRYRKYILDSLPSTSWTACGACCNAGSAREHSGCHDPSDSSADQLLFTSWSNE